MGTFVVGYWHEILVLSKIGAWRKADELDVR
jgi:hypothetical protein